MKSSFIDLRSPHFVAALLMATCMLMLTPLNAETLYKWREADGSLTFSPKPPPEGSGIKFEVVSQPANNSPELAAASGDSRTGDGTNDRVTPLQKDLTGSAARSKQTVAGVEFASGADSGLQINQTAQNVARQSATQPAANSGNRKSEHCNQLRKRVISLERLLRTELTAETMDNAVIQMAKYQNGINQACRG